MKILDFINYAKKFVVALTAAIAQVSVVAADGIITGAEWITVVIAFAAAVGVYTATNANKGSL